MLRKIKMITNLDKKYKLWIFRIGVISFCFTVIGLIIFLGWYGWNDDKLKRKLENQKLSGTLEEFYYIWGWIVLVLGISLLLEYLMGYIFEIS